MAAIDSPPTTWEACEIEDELHPPGSGWGWYHTFIARACGPCGRYVAALLPNVPDTLAARQAAVAALTATLRLEGWEPVSARNAGTLLLPSFQRPLR